MIIRFQQLAVLLQKKRSHFYLLHGSEPFLIEESAQLIREAIKSTDEIAYHLFAHPAVIDLSIIQQSSLFASKQLIEIKLVPQASSFELITNVLSFVGPDIHFIIHIGQLNRKHQQSKWFLQAEQQGIVVEHWPLSSAQFSQWLMARAKDRGVVLSPEMLQLLIFHTEGNYLAAAQEIDKISLSDQKYSPFLQQSQFDVFELMEAVLRQQSTRVIKIFNCLKASDTPLQLMMWAVSQTVHALLDCVIHPATGRQILQRFNIRFALYDLYLQRADQLSVAYCSNLLCCLSQAEKQIKSEFNASAAWRVILEICLSLAGLPLSISAEAF